METLEKRADFFEGKMPVDLRTTSIKKTLEKRADFFEGKMPVDLRTTSIREPAYKIVDSEKEESLSVYDMAEYSCDAGGPCQCHCATY